MKPIMCLAVALFAASCAAPPADAPVAASAPMRSCIRPSEVVDTKVRDDRTIDFIMRGNPQRIERNHLSSSCPQLAFDQSIAWSTGLDRLCSTDQVQVLRLGSPVPGRVCSLGRFKKLAAAR